MSRALATIAVSGLLLSCGGSSEEQESARTARDAKDDTSKQMAGGDQPEDDRGRCKTEGANREVSQYDTTGDNRPDVRKVFLVKGEAPDTNLILVCREADLNGDGTKDIVRYYDEDGSPIREESDRDFDGQMDQISYFEDGQTIRKELDNNDDGKVDAKLYYENGQPIRAERDRNADSTANQWRPDRWEYFQHGRLVRMGTDVDGDGKVDRWDRNEELRNKFEKQDRQQQDGGAGDGGVPDGGAAEGGVPDAGSA